MDCSMFKIYDLLLNLIFFLIHGTKKYVLSVIKNGKNGTGKVEICFKSEEELQQLSSLFGAIQNA